MSDNLDLSANITTEEPEVAADLDQLRWLVLRGLKGDTGDSAYEEAVALGFVGTEAEWIASLKGEKGDPGDSGAVFLELKTVSNRQVITYNGEQITGAEIDAMYLSGALPVVEYSGRIFVPNKNCYNSGSPSARNTSFMFSRPVSAIETTFISVRYDSSVVNIINEMVYPYFDSGDDEGKVLTVGDDDTLHWETPQGGSDADEIAVIDIADDFSMSIGGDAVTAAEIVGLAQSGKTVIGRYDVDGDGGIIVTMHAATDEDDGGGNTGVTFTGVLFWRSAWHVCVADAGNNQSTLSAEYHQLLPAASVSDSGKVPTVNSIGGYSLQTPSGSATVIVTIDESADPMTASMTAAEIKAAADNGERVVLSVSGYEIPYATYIGNTVVFSEVINIDTPSPVCMTIYVNSEKHVLPSMTYLAQTSDIPTQQQMAEAAVFIAVRGTTTEAEIREAHGDGKVVICIYQNRVYYLSDDGATVTLRTNPDATGMVYALIVTDNRWVGINYNLALKSDIPSLSAYRTASAQDTIDAAQDAAIAAKYTKPSGGIPASDLASDVIPSVPQMATQTSMSDWTSGKTVDAAVLKTDFQFALNTLGNIADAVDFHENQIGDLQTGKADKTEIPSLSGYATETWVQNRGFQTAPFEIEITGSGTTYTTTATAQQILDNADNCVAVFSNGVEKAKPDAVFRNGATAVSIQFTVGIVVVGYLAVTQIVVSAANGSVDVAVSDTQLNPLPSVTASDNGKALVVENGAWAASGALQSKAITDTGGYFTTDTVDGALQEIGAELAGVNTLIGSGVIS